MDIFAAVTIDETMIWSKSLSESYLISIITTFGFTAVCLTAYITVSQYKSDD